MQIHRIKKDRDFTIINNAIFKGKLSLKARGLYCQIMSFPDDWDLSIKGLEALLPDGRRAISSAMQELVNAGLAKFTKFHNGRHLEQFWEVFEEPQNVDSHNVESENVKAQNVKAQNVKAQNVTQYKNLINKELTDKEPTNKNNTCVDFEIKKESFGEFQNVKLSEEENKKLKDVYGQDLKEAIETLDSYLENNPTKRVGKKAYKSHYAVLKQGGWVHQRVYANGKEKKATAASVTANSNWEGIESGVYSWADFR